MATPAIDDKTIAHLAQLARLALNEGEVAPLVKDLRAILGYIEQLNQLSLGEVSATAHAVALTCPSRDDSPEPSLPSDKVFQNAPEKAEGTFKVPKIIEGTS